MSLHDRKYDKLMKNRGFTIVELLIVIVVIGILAAITIVAYRGVSNRAESTAIVARASAYVKGLKLWEADMGSRPEYASCIAPSSYTTCPNAYDWYSNVSNDTTFNQQLAKYSGVATPILGKFGPDSPKGLMWYHNNYYSDNRAVFHYEVSVNDTCGMSGVLSPPYDEMTLSGAAYTSRGSDYTECMIEVFKW